MDSNYPVLSAQQSRIMRLIRSEGALSRSQLHQRTDLRPNTVGNHVNRLLRMGLIRQLSARTDGPGRPRVPLAIDPSRLHVVGAAIRPRHVEACRLNLRGEPLGRLITRKIHHPSHAVATTAQLLRKIVDDRTFLVGLSTPGFLDPPGHRILFSSALPGEQPVSLDPLLQTMEKHPLVADNDMRALGSRWLQEHDGQLDEDVLLIYLDDGQLGSVMLVGGEPNRGCLVGGNELGHTRLAVETDKCYCGHTGCLERIASTEFLRRHGGGTLLERVVAYDGREPAMDRMIELLATGLANPINFIRPHRVVLVSPYTRYGPFINALMRAIRSRVIMGLVGRVRYDYWDQAATGAAETAGWLALASIYHPEWTKTILLLRSA